MIPSGADPVQLLAVPALTAVAGTPIVLRLAALTERAPVRIRHLASPAVRAVVATIQATAALLLALCGEWWVIVLAAPLLTVGIAAALVDIRETRLPYLLTRQLWLLAAAAAIVTAIIERDVAILGRAAAGAAGALAMMRIAKATAPTSVGWGDVRLAPSLGCYLGAAGWSTLYAGLFLWWLLIALSAALSLATGLLRRTDPLPYGPAMVLGTVLALAVVGGGGS